jgi:hypothetical protein
MAVRKPLYYDGGNLKEMTTAMVTEVVEQTCYQYALNPSVTITVEASNQAATSHFPNLTDTRYKSGAAAVHASSPPNEATTEEPQVVSVTWNRLVRTYTSVSPSVDGGKTWPLYYTPDGHLQAMNLQDVKDTLLHPAIDLLIAAGTPSDTAGGTYMITTSPTPSSGFTVVSSGAKLFSDTKANIPGYTAGEIGTAGTYQDDNLEVFPYHLHIKNAAGSSPSYTDPLYVTSDNDLQTFTSATFKALLQEWIRETASESGDGYQIQYNLNGSGNLRTNMLNKALTGVTGTHTTDSSRGGDDYRAQEFPNGTLATANTYTFNITKG